MAFSLSIEFSSHQDYMRGYLERFFAKEGVEANVYQQPGMIVMEADTGQRRLETALTRLGEQLPASVFMHSSSHRIDDTPFVPATPLRSEPLPLNLGLCPQCRAEMLDPGSRRYYYPFTGCACCGPQYAFAQMHPFVRPNTVFSFFLPCKACETELERNPFRRDYPLISCHDCGIPVEMLHKGKSRYANAPETFKTLFEIAAKVLSEGKMLLVKTTFGYRKFTLADKASETSTLLHINPESMADDLSLTPQEVHALASLEKPLLKVALKSEALKAHFGPAVYAKLPDEGMTMLLAQELKALGLHYVAYAPADADDACDYLVTFDLPISSQSEMVMAVNREGRLVVQGERVSFPARLDVGGDTLGIAGDLAAVPEGDTHLVDRIDRFEAAKTNRIALLEGSENPVAHANVHTFTASLGALMSALYSHGIRDEKAVGVYFEGASVCFDYFSGHGITTVVPPVAFETAGLTERLSGLREGSERLMGNLARNAPELLDILKRAEDENLPFFETLSLLCALGSGGFETLDDAALTFMGKGGTQVDCHLKDSRFNPYAVIGSLLSYRAAGVESVMLSYSLFESLGDYFTETLQQLADKANAPHVVLCGRNALQTSLHSRILQKMKTRTPIVNRSFPAGTEGAIAGSVFL